MPPHDVTELPHPAKFHQDDAIGDTPDRQPGFKDHVGSRLAGRADLRILIVIRIFRSERDNFIRGKQDNHRLRPGKSRIYNLAYVWAGFPGGDEGVVPFDWRQPDGAQEREDGATRRTVSAMHHKHPPLPLDCRARPAPCLIGVPGRA